MAQEERRPQVAWVPEPGDVAEYRRRVPGVEVDWWDGTGALPDSYQLVEFLVAPLFPPGEFWDALTRLPSLRYLQLLSSGFEHAIDRIPTGVILLNGRGIHDIAVAEWVMAAILAQQRGLPKYLTDQRDHRWDRVPTRTLNDCRVLLVGYGSIARVLEKLLAPFGAIITRVASRARNGIHSVLDLNDLLGDADIVVLLLPDSPGTHNLLGREQLALLQYGALVVNAGRGGVIDQSALFDELDSRRLRAALDVFVEEPVPRDDPIWDAPGLIMTPHAASDTSGKAERLRAFVAAQLQRFASNEALINVVESNHDSTLSHSQRGNNDPSRK